MQKMSPTRSQKQGMQTSEPGSGYPEWKQRGMRLSDRKPSLLQSAVQTKVGTFLHKSRMTGMLTRESVATHNIPLYSRAGISPGARYIQLIVGSSEVNVTAPLQNVQDSAHIAPITIGNQSFLGLLDTGSADTWIASSKFKCARTFKTCAFPATYNETSSFVEVPNRKIDIIYSTGERLRGKVGREVVSFGGVTVSNATIAVVNDGEFMGDGASSGVIGMAFSGDTRVFASDTDIDVDPEARSIPYAPVFTEMYEQGLVAPYFSIALQRQGESSGMLALGGLPGAPIKYSNNFTHANFEYLIFDDGSYGRPGNRVKEYSLYMIKTKGFSVASKEKVYAVNAIFDTGSPINYVPPDIAAAVAKGFTPPGTRDQKSWQFVVNCDAIPPAFGININGTTLMVDPENMIIKGATSKGSVGALPVVTGRNKCLSTVQESGIFSFGVHILGAPFLKSVVAVFDVGAAEMRFAKRLR
jgi:hypothetical protein